MKRDFKELVSNTWDESKFLCVGLDSEFEKLPKHLKSLGVSEAIVAFNCAIVDATHKITGSYKLNSAFYEACGVEGIQALRNSVDYIQNAAPGVPVILDAKRADNSNSNKGYVEYAFEYLKVDAITVHPYMGSGTLKPFLDRKEKGIIVLCRTSNPGDGEFQDLEISGEPLYRLVARAVKDRWNTNGNCGLVVGATRPDELREVRKIVGRMPILMPGIGAQGGDIEAAVKAGKDEHGQGMMINASRSIIFASDGKDFAEAAEKSAQEMHDAIQKALVENKEH